MQLHARDVCPISVLIPTFYVHATQHFTACPPALALVHHLCSLYMFFVSQHVPLEMAPNPILSTSTVKNTEYTPFFTPTRKFKEKLGPQAPELRGAG